MPLNVWCFVMAAEGNEHSTQTLFLLGMRVRPTAASSHPLSAGLPACSPESTCKVIFHGLQLKHGQDGGALKRPSALGLVPK